MECFETDFFLARLLDARARESYFWQHDSSRQLADTGAQRC